MNANDFCSGSVPYVWMVRLSLLLSHISPVQVSQYVPLQFWCQSETVSPGKSLC